MTSDTQLSRFLQLYESSLPPSLLGRGRGRAPAPPGVLPTPQLGWLSPSPTNHLQKHPRSDIDSQPEEVTEE